MLMAVSYAKGEPQKAISPVAQEESFFALREMPFQRQAHDLTLE
jgi:hypothetical protein